MKPLREAWCCQIELTNVCQHKCAYCTRYNRHVSARNRFHLTMDQLRTALLSLVDWPGKIGIIGGEPTLHPQFEEACDVIREVLPHPRWVGLWTSGGRRYQQHLATIQRTFSWVAYHDHTVTTELHQPMTVASRDSVPDEKLREELIDQCWVQRIWCPTIGPKGAFFCEVAYAIDTLFDGPGGWPIEPGWWGRIPEDYAPQKWACQCCGMAVPMPRDTAQAKKEIASETIMRMMMERGLPCSSTEHFEPTEYVLRREDLPKAAEDWMPGAYKPGTNPGGLP